MEDDAVVLPAFDEDIGKLRTAGSPDICGLVELPCAFGEGNAAAVLDEATGGVICGLLSADDEPFERDDGGRAGELFRLLDDLLDPGRVLLRMLPA